MPAAATATVTVEIPFLPWWGKPSLRVEVGAEIDEGLRQHEGAALAIDHLLPALEQSANIAGTGAEAPAIQVLDAILANAVARQASDIHLEPEHACLRIRYHPGSSD